MTLEDGDATLRFDIPPTPSYAISAPEVIYAQLPGAAVKSATKIVASPALVVHADAGAGSFAGHLHGSPKEEVIRSASGTNLSLVLDSDVWQPTVGQPHLSETAYGLHVAIIDGLVSGQSEAAGWNRVVQRALRPEHIRRLVSEASFDGSPTFRHRLT